MKDRVVQIVRDIMYRFAVFLNRITNGKIKPSHITLISLLGHIPVAWALVTCRPVLGAVLLAIFSIMDALDGALAKAQNTASLKGMYMDAVSDRLKEIIVFTALAVLVTKHYNYEYVWLVVAVTGTSLLVSYTKAKGEMAIASEGVDKQKLNRIFGGGLAGISSYEVRVVALIIGLLFGIVLYILAFLLVANLYTAAIRYIRVSRELKIIDRKAKK